MKINSNTFRPLSFYTMKARNVVYVYLIRLSDVKEKKNILAILFSAFSFFQTAHAIAIYMIAAKRLRFCMNH